MELQQWKQDPGVREAYLTLEKVCMWAEGETYDVLCLDRNIEDLVCNGTHTTATPPPEFFENAYTMRLEVSGSPRTPFAPPRIVQKWLGPGMQSEEDPEWEFNVEYAKGRWFPMENGLITGFQPTGDDGEGIFVLPRQFRGLVWEDFPESTRVGWRGPMILIDDLPNLPLVKEDVYEEAAPE